jgi:hypothetical protein
MRNLQINLIPKWSSSNKISELIEELPNLCNNFEYQISNGLLPSLGDYFINSYEYDINDLMRNPNNKIFKITVPDKKEEDEETSFYNRYFVITSSTFIILMPVNEKYKNICQVNYVGDLVEIEKTKIYSESGEEYKDLDCYQILWNKYYKNQLDCVICGNKEKSVIKNIDSCLIKRKETLLSKFKYIQNKENVNIKTLEEIIKIKEKLIENRTNEAIFEEINNLYQKIIEVLSSSNGDEFKIYLKKLHNFIDSYDKLKLEENKVKELLKKKENNDNSNNSNNNNINNNNKNGGSIK